MSDYDPIEKEDADSDATPQAGGNGDLPGPGGDDGEVGAETEQQLLEAAEKERQRRQRMYQD